MLTVAIYHCSVAGKNNAEKINILENFATGVNANRDRVLHIRTHSPALADVGVIQGWISQTPIKSKHGKLREDVIKSQKALQKKVVAVDSNLFLYATPGNPLHYLRYSFNDVFPFTGIYCDDKVDPQQWKKLSTNLNLTLKDYRTNGEHIVLCLQRNGGWSMGALEVITWIKETIAKLRDNTDRPILLRPHPGDKHAYHYLKEFEHMSNDKIFISVPGSTLMDDLRNCWAVVNHNSSSVVGAAIEGYPVFVTDPGKSQCRDIANLDLNRIEKPLLPDRQAWVERLAMSHWNFDELKSGECWTHMRKYV